MDAAHTVRRSPVCPVYCHRCLLTQVCAELPTQVHRAEVREVTEVRDVCALLGL
jgi:hypothetical protein